MKTVLTAALATFWSLSAAAQATLTERNAELLRELQVGIHLMREAHNRVHAADKRWSYGPTYQPQICATGSFKSPGCNGGSWAQCGSNTYPTLGVFPHVTVR